MSFLVALGIVNMIICFLNHGHNFHKDVKTVHRMSCDSATFVDYVASNAESFKKLEHVLFRNHSVEDETLADLGDYFDNLRFKVAMDKLKDLKKTGIKTNTICTSRKTGEIVSHDSAMVDIFNNETLMKVMQKFGRHNKQDGMFTAAIPRCSLF